MTTRGFHILPPTEDRCVWMNAGILSYQLCDHRFECDCCPLDAAMRMHRSPPEEGDVPPVSPPAVDLRPDRQYSANHCWIQKQNGGRLRIGLEPALAAALPAPREVVYPTPGQRLSRGRTCLWVVVEGETLALKSPLDGCLKATNEELVAAPHLLQTQPFERGWLFEMDSVPTSTDGGVLMEVHGAAAAYAADHARLMINLHGAIRGRHPALGTTVERAVPQVESAVQMLGASRYVRLVRQAFHN